MTNDIHDYIEAIKRIGLTEYEARVYLNLLKKQYFSASEIAKLSAISRSKIYEILNGLKNKGFCVEILGKIKKYSAVNPEFAFESLVNHYRKEFIQNIEQKKSIMDEVSKNLSSLYVSEKSNKEPLDYIEVIHDHHLAASKVKALERITKKEILAFGKAPYAIDLKPDYMSTKIAKCPEHIDYKAVCEFADAHKKDFFKVMKLYEDAGEQIRVTESLPLKIHIFDERIVLLCMENKFHKKGSLTSMMVEHADLAKTLRETFFMYWEKSMTLEEFGRLYFPNEG